MRRAIVTGGTGGIGSAVCSSLRQQGYRVESDRVDLCDEVAVARWCKTLGALPIDVLIHGAGALRLAPVASGALEDFDYQYAVNVRAPFQITQALLPNLRSAQGQIVFLNSTVGLKASASGSQYGATKHALKALADSLRDEVNPDGIRVLSVFLGRTASRMQAEVCLQEGKPYRPERLIQPEDIAHLVTAALDLPRTAELTDLCVRPLLKG